MKRKPHATLSILATVLSAYSAVAAGADVIEGRLTQVMQSHVIVDHSQTFRFDPRNAQCFDFRGDKMTCETLVGIGYADKARVTVVGDTVQRVDIIELQQ